MTALVPVPMALPLLGAALVTILSPLHRERLFATVALVATAASTAICIVLLKASLSGPLIYWFGAWTPRQGVALGISFVVDPLGAGLATLAAFLVLAALVYAWWYFDAVGTLFHTLVLVFLGGMVGFCLTGDLFNLFVFFELMGAAAYALTGYKVEEEGPIQGAINFAVVNTVGAFFALSGVALLYARTGALNMAQIGRALNGHPADALVVVSFALVSVGLLVKGAIVPLHFWLADAHAAAPTPICVLFSGVMVELGLYGAIRVYATIFAGVFAPHLDALRLLLVCLGAVTAVVGGVMCYAQRHLKRLLAFSTISHMGTFLVGAGLLGPEGLAATALAVLAHAFAKGGLFMGTGILLQHFGTVDEIDLCGRGRRLWLLAICFALGGLALADMPPFGAGIAKHLLGEALDHADLGWVSPVLLVASALTGGATLRATGRVFLGFGRTSGDVAQRAPSHGGEEREGRQNDGSNLPVTMLVPTAVLILLALAQGFVPDLTGWAHAAAERFLDQQGYLAAVLDGRFTPPPLPVAPGETSGFGWEIGSTAAAILVAALSLGIGRLPGALESAVEHAVEAVIAPIRALHTGHVGDMTTWLLATFACYGGFCLLTLR